MIVCQSVLALWWTAGLYTLLHPPPTTKNKQNQVQVTNKAVESARVLQVYTTRWHKRIDKSELFALCRRLSNPFVIVRQNYSETKCNKGGNHRYKEAQS